MSIIGAVVRLRPQFLPEVVARVSELPGVEVSMNPGDGRLVLVIEDLVIDGLACSAAATLAAITLWPQVLNTALVYEYSGPDSPATHEQSSADYHAWRGNLQDMADPNAAFAGSNR